MHKLLCCFFLVITTSAQAQVLFTRGVNLTNWFQTSSPRQIQFTKYSKKDFERIKSLGCDVIRLPINLHAMTSGDPDYILDPLFLQLLDSAVTWSEELQLHLLLDNHTFDPAANTDPSIESTLIKVWTQMAAHYKNRSGFIYYEVLNEPHGIDEATWGTIQQNVIAAIRSVDTTHYIVVGGANWNSYNSLNGLPEYTDEKLIYTFHFYDPFIFTHQGASWTDPSMVPLSGVPFPYRAGDMPATPATLKGTWIEGAINNYSFDGTVARIKSLLDVAANFRNARNVPVFCGEFGVYIPNSDNDDRVYWYNAVRQYMEEKNIPWTIWDYQGGFGLFKKNSNELFDHDLNVPMLNALGFDAPPQQPYIKKPKTTGFILYDDFIREGIFDASYPGDGRLDYYNTEEPQEGNNCLYWANVSQYSSIALDFQPDLDMSLLPGNDYVVEFWTRGNTTDIKFDIRFIDTKTGAADHPWRMGKTIDNTFADWDGTWQKISVPLNELEEKGSYDNAWFPPEGKFDWKAVDRFEIVAEDQSLEGIEFWFDDIRISGEDIPYDDNVTAIGNEFESRQFRVSPNPMENRVTIRYSIKESGPTRLRIYSFNGQPVKTLMDTFESAGDYAAIWEGNTDSGQLSQPGLYFVELKTNRGYEIRKLVKLF